MSMDAISTEVDELIIESLRSEDVSAMSKVNKYYRGLAEKRLYRNLTFHTDCYYRINRLFLTVVDRPDIAKLIRSFMLTRKPSSHPISPVTDADRWAFWNEVTAVKALLEKMVKGRGPDILIRWLSRIYAGKCFFDGALAAILCLATNLEDLHFEVPRHDHLPITKELLGYSWYRPKGSSEDFPFCKLKVLCTSDDGAQTLPLLPKLEYLITSGAPHWFDETNAQPVSFPYPTKLVGTNLRGLVIKGLDVDPAVLETILSSPTMFGVKELIVSGLRTQTGGPWTGYDLQNINKAIEINLPDLENLDWSHQKLNTLARSCFGSFKDSSKLRALEVDAQFLSTDNHPSLHLTHPQEYLPDSLVALHIASLKEDDEKIDLALEAARTIGLKVIDLSLNLERWESEHVFDDTAVYELPKARRKYFRKKVAEMATLGIEMHVWRQKGRYPKELLFGTRFQRKWPIWEDVDPAFWMEVVRVGWMVKKGQRDASELDDEQYTGELKDYLDEDSEEELDN